MAPEWQKIDVPADPASLSAGLRTPLTLLPPDEVRVYRSDTGRIALVFALGEWLAAGRPGLQWTPAERRPGVAREESAALLTEAVETSALDELQAAARRDGVEVVWVARPAEAAPTAASAAEIRSGTLTLGSGQAALTFTVDRLAEASPALHESPVSLRKRPEGPSNLRDREGWFRSRTGSSQ